ncbi:MAG: hypothetical protein KBS81_04920, partial [Spirochaetales bacterium]|nr:hypothetical protein [Candidatus Physcosoma equi]
MKKVLAIALVALVAVSAIFAQGQTATTPTPAPAATPAATPAAAPAPVAKPTTAVYATASFGMKFSLFFAATAYDQDIVSLTSGGLLAADRGGAIIYNGIKGET